MRVELYDRLGKPISAEATRVVVYDDFDRPVCVSISYQPGHIRNFRVEDDDFPEQLAMAGVDRTKVIGRPVLLQPPPSSGRGG